MKKLILFIASALLFSCAYPKGYKIKVELNGISNDTLFLAYYFADKIYPADTAITDKAGVATFTGKDPLDGGLYMIFHKASQKKFDILIGEDQEFSVYNDTTDLLNNMTVEGDIVNERFLNYSKTIQADVQKRKDLLAQKDSTNKKKNEKIDKQLEELSEEVKTFMSNSIEENKDNFLGVFLNAVKEVEVPDPPRDEDGNITDSSFQYHYYRNHYFDNFDFTDPRLLKTPFYKNKIMQYITRVVPQIPDTLIKEVDTILTKSKSNEEIYRYNLITLFNHFAQSRIMGMDAVHLHIAEYYYLPDATWADSAFVDKLTKYVEENKGLLIGKKAPDVDMMVLNDAHFMAAANDTAIKNNVHAGVRTTLYNIDAPYIILAFWEKDCGHCRKTIPELHKVYMDTLADMGVYVVSFHMLFGVEGKQKWVDFVNEKEMYSNGKPWFNAWYPYGYQFKIDYNIKSTPQIYLLDKDKKIIAKKISPEQAVEIVKELEKRKKEK